MNKNSIYYEYLQMSTNNIENPRIADFELYFERVEDGKKNLKKAYNFIISSYPEIDKERLNKIYELFQ